MLISDRDRDRKLTFLEEAPGARADPFSFNLFLIPYIDMDIYIYACS